MAGYGRLARLLRELRYIEKNSGATLTDLARLAGCSERIAYQDILTIRQAGENVVCKNGRYHLCSGSPDPQEEPPPPKNKTPKKHPISWNIFRKWYRTDARDNEWFVVRADLKDDQGVKIGPVGAGKKNFYLNALKLVEERNNRILSKRAELIEYLKSLGYTTAWIEQQIHIQQDLVRNTVGQDYQEDMK